MQDKITIADAPDCLNTNDKAMWVLGYEAAIEARSTCLLQIQEPLTKTEALAHYSQQAILAMDEAAPAAKPVVLPEPHAAVKEVMSLVNQAVRIGQEAARHDLQIRPTDCVNSLKRLDSSMLATETKLRALLAGVSAPAAVALEPRPTDAAFLAWWEPYELSDHWFVELHKIARDAWNAALNSPQAQADARDAERYRLLRNEHEGEAESLCVFGPNDMRECLVPIGSLPGELDAFIDAAIAAAKGE